MAALMLFRLHRMAAEARMLQFAAFLVFLALFCITLICHSCFGAIINCDSSSAYVKYAAHLQRSRLFRIAEVLVTR